MAGRNSQPGERVYTITRKLVFCTEEKELNILHLLIINLLSHYIIVKFTLYYYSQKLLQQTYKRFWETVKEIKERSPKAVQKKSSPRQLKFLNKIVVWKGLS